MAVFLNNSFLDDEQALLHVSDLVIQRGYAAFDFCRTVNGVPLFMHDHLERFYASAAAMHLAVAHTKEELTAIVHELVQISSLREAGIRLMLTGGYSTDSYHLAEPNLLITCNPVKTVSAAEMTRGVSIITYEHQRELPHIKSTNYLMAVWLLPLLQQQAADDVLYYNKESVTEFPRSNVFVITNDGTLVTPAHNILKGITRKKILLLANEIMQVDERNITVHELASAKEIFLTSTTKKILPVVKLNGATIGDGKPGPATLSLYEKFVALEQIFYPQINAD